MDFKLRELWEDKIPEVQNTGQDVWPQVYERPLRPFPEHASAYVPPDPHLDHRIEGLCDPA